MNNEYGYNPEVAINAMKTLSHYRSDNECILGHLSDDLITSLSQSWFAPESKTVVKDLYDSLYEESESEGIAFKDISDKMERTCVRWASTVGESFPTGWYLAVTYKRNCTVEMMKDDSNGFRGIVAGSFEDALGLITKAKADFEAKALKFTYDFNQYEFLFGADQMNTLFYTVKKVVNDAKQRLDDIANNIEFNMKNTEEKYGNVARENAQTFASGN